MKKMTVAEEEAHVRKILRAEAQKLVDLLHPRFQEDNDDKVRTILNKMTEDELTEVSDWISEHDCLCAHCRLRGLILTSGIGIGSDDLRS